MLVTKINLAVGIPPVGWEFVPYLLSAVCFVVVLSAVIKILLLPLRLFRR